MLLVGGPHLQARADDPGAYAGEGAARGVVGGVVAAPDDARGVPCKEAGHEAGLSGNGGGGNLVEA